MTEARSSTRRPVPNLAVIAIGLVAVAIIAVVGLAWPQGEWRRSGAPLAASGWAPYWQTDSALASFTSNAELFADVSIVAYQATGARSVIAYDGLATDALTSFRTAATAAGVPLLATIFDGTQPGAMAAILADPVTRSAHVRTVVGVVDSGGFDGVDLDYEVFAFGDDRSTWATTRPNWIAFLTELSAVLHGSGKLLVVSVPPVYDGGRNGDSGYWVYDYAAMGAVVDRIRVMAYDYSTSEPGPIAPITWVQRVVTAAAELVPPSKIDLGLPAYGYDWVVAVSGTCPTDQQPRRRSISTARAAREAAAGTITPVWDDVAAEMTYGYSETLTGPDAAGATVTCTLTRTVHYVDARAIERRSYIAYRHDLHGVAVWSLGSDDAASWQAIRSARLGTLPAAVPTTLPGETTVTAAVPST